MTTYYWTDSAQNYYTYAWLSGLNSGTYYNVTISGLWDGTWETIGTCSFTTESDTLQPPASFSCEEHNGQINTFSVTHASGATSTEFFYYWLDSQGVLAGSYTVSVPVGTTSGEHNTGCPYNATIYYNLRSYDGTNYSAWKDTVGNSYYFTSGSAPGLYTANGSSGNETGGRWHPSYLTNHWNTSYYQQAVISLDSSGSSLDGGSAAPSNILDTMNAPSSGTLHSPSTQEYTTGLMPGTYYVAYCYVRVANGLWYYVGSDDFTTGGTAPTKLATPTLSFGSATPTSITLNIGTVTGGYYYDVNIYDGSHNYLGSVTSTGSSVTFDHSVISSIMPNTAYYFSVSARPTSGSTTYLESDESGYYGTWSTPTSGRPSAFSWDTAKVAGQPGTPTAVELNRLVQNIKDVHIYKLGSYDASTYPLDSFTQGNDFLAIQFNRIRFAIGSLNPTGISAKSARDPLTAADLNLLVSVLNAIT
jgi:hypothetical protein